MVSNIIEMDNIIAAYKTCHLIQLEFDTETVQLYFLSSFAPLLHQCYLYWCTICHMCHRHGCIIHWKLSNAMVRNGGKVIYQLHGKVYSLLCNMISAKIVHGDFQLIGINLLYVRYVGIMKYICHLDGTTFHKDQIKMENDKNRVIFNADRLLIKSIDDRQTKQKYNTNHSCPR